MIVIALVVLIVVLFLVVKYKENSKINTQGLMVIVAGLRGSGKSYFLTREALKYIKAGYYVFSNFPIRGAFRITIDDVMNKVFPSGSIIIYDEAHNEFDADFHRAPEVKESFVLLSQSRKLGYTILLSSQNPIRIAKAIRDITDYFIWAENGLFFNYSVYLSFDHWLQDIVYKRFKLFKRKLIFNSYDSFYCHVDVKDRVSVSLNEWDVDVSMPEIEYRRLDSRAGAVRRVGAWLERRRRRRPAS